MKSTQSRGVRDMTAGSPAKHIIAFSLPLMVGSLFQLLYNTVDSWVVGQYVGDGALAAVGVGFPVVTMLASLFIGLSNGGTVVIAQFFGAGNTEQVRDAIIVTTGKPTPTAASAPSPTYCPTTQLSTVL